MALWLSIPWVYDPRYVTYDLLSEYATDPLDLYFWPSLVAVAEEDIANRLYDISGPTLEHFANGEPAGSWQNVTLHYGLPSFNVVANTTIGKVMMVPRGGYTCHSYDGV